MADQRTAGVPPAVSGASRPRFGAVQIRDRGRLPHWESESACYFVTFRLADSLPNSALQGFLAERRAIVATAAQLGRELSNDERKKLAVLFGAKIERYLHIGRGECLLKRDDCAAIVARALQYFDDKRYRLQAWCVAEPRACGNEDVPRACACVCSAFLEIVHCSRDQQGPGTAWDRLGAGVLRSSGTRQRGARTSSAVHPAQSRQGWTCRLAVVRPGRPHDSRRDASGTRIRASISAEAHSSEKLLLRPRSPRSSWPGTLPAAG